MLETLGKKALLSTVHELFDEAISADSEWQISAKESFEFRDGSQWADTEIDLLESSNRPHLTFNITKAHIDLIMGINEDQRTRYVCTPVNEEDGFRCEVLNNIISLLYEKGDWIDEEDVSFESAVICGRGWTAIDFDINPNRYDQIKITESNIPVHEVRRDPASRKTDLTDASYIIWDKWLTIEDFVVKYPHLENKVKDAFATGSWPIMDSISRMAPESTVYGGHDIDDVSDYSDSLDVDFYDTKKRQLRVAHMEYWKTIKKHWFLNPTNNTWEIVNKKWSVFQKEFALAYPEADLEFEVRTTKEVWWVQFGGNEILYHGKSPISFPGFNIIPCFLYGDVSRRKSNHFGIVELMKDAQREINKRVSQTLNLLANQVQPGMYAEVGAFVNQDQAEQSVKEPGSVTWLKDGAITKKRFQERSIPSFPAAIMQMEQFAQEIVRRITGINPDLMGTNDKRQEPGIVVQLRQQQGMTILKPVFKAYNRMRRGLFRRQISIITEHMPSQQIAMILGQQERFQIDDNGTITDKKTELTCNIRDLQGLDFDVDGEPEQSSMTQNMMELATYTEMQKNGFPVDPAVIVSKTNLPITEKVGWIEYLDNQQKGQSEQAEKEFALEKQKLDQLHQREMAKLKIEMLVSSRKIANQREKDHLKASGDQAKMDDTKERDMLNLMLKVTEEIHKVQQNNKESAEKLLQMMTDTKMERREQVLKLVDTFIKSKKDIKVAEIHAAAMKQNKKEGEKKDGKSNGTKS